MARVVRDAREPVVPVGREASARADLVRSARRGLRRIRWCWHRAARRARRGGTGTSAAGARRRRLRSAGPAGRRRRAGRRRWARWRGNGQLGAAHCVADGRLVVHLGRPRPPATTRRRPSNSGPGQSVMSLGGYNGTDPAHHAGRVRGAGRRPARCTTTSPTRTASSGRRQRKGRRPTRSSSGCSIDVHRADDRRHDGLRPDVSAVRLTHAAGRWRRIQHRGLRSAQAGVGVKPGDDDVDDEEVERDGAEPERG